MTDLQQARVNTVDLADIEDGRNRRRAANRDKIVTAFLTLVREGNPTPSAQAVAEHADVSPRTVFRCFQDMETLYREISVLLREEFLPRATLNLNTPDRRERLSRLVTNRAKLFEDMRPFRQAAEAQSHLSTTLATDKAFVTAIEKERLRQAVNPDGKMDKTLMDALTAATSFNYWLRLRAEQGLSPEEAAKAMSFAAFAIFDAGGDAGPIAL
ncbi:TetR/AcrR family transcriptional regulator [Pseudokordiimonas caeni]|uniref:TetR/AcrR family transcriptional regulator n=1 Tax=Pseudokordiimonas caeni TaxID=2997908 RepID=UPI002810AEBF|nr:hypothetical protein [Pseudokordiimonas caeni]